MRRREHDDGRAVLEPAHLLPFSEVRRAGLDPCTAIAHRPLTQRGRRMLATSTAATGTGTSRPAPGFSAASSRTLIGARSFLQNSRSIRLSAIEFTFQVSPAI